MEANCTQMFPLRDAAALTFRRCFLEERRRRSNLTVGSDVATNNNPRFSESRCLALIFDLPCGVRKTVSPAKWHGGTRSKNAGVPRQTKSSKTQRSKTERGRNHQETPRASHMSALVVYNKYNGVTERSDCGVSNREKRMGVSR